MKKGKLIGRICAIAVVGLMIGGVFGLGSIFAPTDNRTSVVEAATLVDGKGMWIWKIWELEGVSGIVSQLQYAGVDWVTIKCGDSNSYYPDHGSMLSWLSTNGYSGFGEVVTEFHNAGIKVLGWQYVYSYAMWTGTGYSTEAAVSNEILDIPGIDGLIIDAEAEYEGTDKGPIAESYMLAIRSQHPSSFIAYAPFPIIDYHTWFPYLEFGKYCDAVMPQAYWQDIGVTPTEMVDWMNEQWDKWHAIWQSGGHGDSIKPLIPIGQGNTPGSEVTEFCGAVLSRYGGVSLWRYGIMTSGAWTAYAACGGATMPIPTISASEYETEIDVGETDWVKFTLSNDGTEYTEEWGIQVRVGDGLELVQHSSYPWSQGNMCNGEAAEWYKWNRLDPAASDYILVGIKGKSASNYESVWYTAWMYDPDGQPESVQYSHPVRSVPCDRDYAEYGVKVTQPNTPPQLSNGYVDPTSGDTSTNFYYYVTYFDLDGDSPNVRQVYIDGTAYTMSEYLYEDSWITYRYGPKNLSAGGTHYYFFYFEDGKGGTARLPAGTDMYLGPTVSPPQTPDLIVDDIWIEPAQFGLGDEVAVRIRYKNVGTADASQTFYCMEYLDDSPMGRLHIDGGLAAGASFQVEPPLYITWPSDYNLHTIKAIVDDVDLIPESNEDNNELSRSFSAIANPPQIELTPSSHDFGNVEVGQCSSEYSFTLTNTGGETATGSVSLTGSNPGDFQITNGGGSFSLGADQSKTIKVKFCSSSTGSSSANLYADGSNCNDDTSSLSGNGVLAPQIELTPSSHSFGDIQVGQCSGTQSFTLENVGGGTATGSVSLTATNANQFEITSGSGSFSLGTGATKTISVRFCPTSTGAKSTNLFADGSNCNDDSSSLSGNGAPPPEKVNISLQPSTKHADVGEVFDLTIQAEAGDQPVSGISAFINFDPAFLEVQSVTPGTSLPTVLQNTYANTAGTIDYSAGKLGEPFPTGNFTVATIQFNALALTSPSTSITFSTSFPRETIADYSGSDVTGTITGGTVFISEAAVDISVVLQGGSRPPEGWEVPITIKFFSPGANVMTDTPLEQFDLTTTKADSTATCQCTVAPSTYEVTAVSEHTLINVRRNMVISGPSTAVDMGTLLEGNANDDSIINISDFGILAVSYMKTEGQPGYDARADFDRNGIINISDFGLLAVNYMKMSPINVSE